MRWIVLLMATACTAQMESSVQWEVSFEHSKTADFANATRYPVSITVPFEHDSGFVRVVARKVEVVDMQKTLMSILSAVSLQGAASADLMILAATSSQNRAGGEPPAPVAGYLPDLDVSEPTNGYPVAFAAYDPPVTNIASDAVVAEWTRSADSNRTVAFSTEETLSGMIVYADTDYDVTPTMHTGYGRATMPADGFKMVWPVYSGSTGTPFRVGGTDLHWAGPGRVSTSEQFVLHGQNLSVDGTGYAYIDGYGWVTNASGDEYRLVFDVPDDLPEGQYDVWAHNGTGGKYGWSTAGTLTVSNLFDYTSSTSTVIAGSFSDFASKYAAAASGTTVYVSNGTYSVTATVTGKNGVRILCESTNAVFVCDSTFTAGNRMFNFDGTYNARVDNMTIDGGDGTPAPGYLLYLDGYNCRFSGCRFTQGNYASRPASGESIYLNGHDGSPVWIEDSDLVWARRGTIKSYVNFIGNDVYGLWYDQAAFKSDGNEHCGNTEIAFTTFRHLNAGTEQDMGGGRSVVFQHSFVWNHSFYGNVSYDMKPYKDGTMDENSGEQWLIEEANVKVIETATSATSNTLVGTYFASGNGANNVITIRSGTGSGQTRRILSVVSGTSTATVEGTWEVVPDSSSVYCVSEGGYRCIIANNVFDGVKDANDTASAGVAFWGGVNNSIVASNVMHQTEYGVRIHSFVGTATTNSEASYFNLIEDNVVSDMAGHSLSGGDRGAIAFTVDKYSSRNSLYTPVIGALCNVIRDSSVENADTGINFGGANSSYSVDGTIIEHISGSATNIYAAGQGANTYTNAITITEL